MRRHRPRRRDADDLAVILTEPAAPPAPGDLRAFRGTSWPPRDPRPVHLPPWQPPGPVLVAENCRTARFDHGACAACGRLVATGDRVADLPGTTEVIHVACGHQAAALTEGRS